MSDNDDFDVKKKYDEFIHANKDATEMLIPVFKKITVL